MTEAVTPTAMWISKFEKNCEQVAQLLVQDEAHDTLSKLTELRHKVQSEQLNIGFCGHFSAGKSSLINRIVGAQLLPTSPIPTSANLVMIRKGNSGALIHFTNGETRSIPLEDVEQWKAYCRDGETVERVELQHEDVELLSTGIQLLDTPGVDSTDVKHQQATENALHLADVIIFVTDYNHVQSEQNFVFLKKLKDQGKAVIMVVNQIDKHRTEELSLSTFLQRIQTGLKEWGAEPDALLFTSLKVADHPYNQLPALLDLFNRFVQQKNELIEYHAYQSLSALVDEHVQKMMKRKEKSLNETKQQIDRLKQEAGWDEAPGLLTEYHQSADRIAAWSETLQQQMDKLIDQAIITPYETTTLAQAFIESKQEQFKVGFLFTASKTEAEREKRLKALHQNLNERIRSQVDWHLKELVKRIADQFGIADESFQQALLSVQVSVDQEWLAEQVKQGIVSTEYVYQYTKEIKDEIRKRYASALAPLQQLGKELLRAAHQSRYEPLQERLKQYEQIEALEDEVKQTLERSRAEMVSVKRGIVGTFPVLTPFDFSTFGPFIEHVIEQQKNGDGEQGVNGRRHTNQSRHPSPQVGVESINRWIKRLEEAKRTLQSVTLLNHLATRLEAPLQRLCTKRFKTCVFGAFSAGKSSFINALIGDKMLPVSPNPTTAAINRLCPVDDEHPHGTIVVHLKTEEQILSEISIALERLQLKNKGNVSQLLNQLESVDSYSLRSSLKPYYTFLIACRKGWTRVQSELGREQTVDMQSFQRYVADESVACFVRQIDVYHQNMYTDAGIELIDTPGADSIYARHTNVTFNYVKHADVVIYLTYYNHAFSRADRTFLEQLGRVKDQFSLDKMFFVVNAADLASSAEELETVVEHVEQNLLQSGIRHPRIHAVSSLRMLEEGQDEGMRAFEQQFNRFLADDLAELSTQPARNELAQALAHVEGLLQQFQSFQTQREQTLKNLRAREQQWLNKIEKTSWPTVKQEIEQEIEEQAFYIKQRLVFNFAQHYHEAFHPSVLSGSFQTKPRLKECLNELLFSLLFQLQEEWRAASIRLERFIKEKQDQRASQWIGEAEKEEMVLTGSDIEPVSFDIPHLPQQLLLEHVPDIHPYFKSAKAFFEQGGKERLRARLEEELNDVVDQYVNETVEQFTRYYQERWEQIEQALKSGFCSEIRQTMKLQQQAFAGAVTEEQIGRVIHNLKTLLNEK